MPKELVFGVMVILPRTVIVLDGVRIRPRNGRLPLEVEC